jgi:hypothetical protein
VDHFSEEPAPHKRGVRLPRKRCVTRRKHRVVPIAIGTWYFSQKAVTSLTLTERSERHEVQACLPAGREALTDFLPSGYKIFWSIKSVTVQFVSEPEICQGAGFILRAGERVRVQEPLQIWLEGSSKAKTVTSQ